MSDRIELSIIIDYLQSIKTFPHHFHDQNGNIKASNLLGKITEDIDTVFDKIKRLLTEGNL